jgi:prevent-host-death family protein
MWPHKVAKKAPQSQPDEDRKMEIGIRDLRNGLSRYLEMVKSGEEITVTEHGRPIARISAASTQSSIDDLIARGIVLAPHRPKAAHLDWTPITSRGGVSDILAEQRRG